MDESEKRIDWAEAVFFIIFAFITDVFDIFADFAFPIPIVGQILWFGAKFISFTAWIIIQAWLIIRKVRGLHQAVFGLGSIADVVIPFSQTITLLLTIYLANHPKAAGALEIGAKIAGSKIGALKEAREGKAPQEARPEIKPEGIEGEAAMPYEAAEVQGKETLPEREGGAPTAEEAPGAKKREKAISEEEFGMEPLEEVKELKAVREIMEKSPEPEKKKQAAPQKTVEVDDSKNQVNLKKAA